MRTLSLWILEGRIDILDGRVKQEEKRVELWRDERRE